MQTIGGDSSRGGVNVFVKIENVFVKMSKMYLSKNRRWRHGVDNRGRLSDLRSTKSSKVPRGGVQTVKSLKVLFR